MYDNLVGEINGAEPGEAELVNKLYKKLEGYQPSNNIHESYYDASFVVRYLGLEIPKAARTLKMVSGWATTTVDVLEERLSWQGWNDPELQKVYDDNALDSESSQVHLDTLIYGTSYISVTQGKKGEPKVLIRGHDAKNTVGIYNTRTRKLDAALTRVIDDEGKVSLLTLWLSTEIVDISPIDHNGRTWEVSSRTRHNLGVVPMVQQINRPRTGDRAGKSEITKAIRTYTDSAVRALTGMEVNREFFSSPQRYIIGMSMDDFKDGNGNIINPYHIYNGRMIGIPNAEYEDEEGNIETSPHQPKVGEFSPVSPGPYLEQIAGLATQLASEAGLPADYLGVHTANPSSADAIAKGESRLIRRTEKRQAQYGHAWNEVGYISHLILGTEDPTYPRSMWMEASTPTLAATTDAMVKMVQADVVPNGSEIVLRRLRFDPEEIRQIQSEQARERATQMAQMGSLREITSEARRASRLNRESES